MRTVLIAIVLAPPQSGAAIWWELIALAIGSAILMLVLDLRAVHATGRGVARYIERFSPNTITPALVLIAGVTLLAHRGGGLYWLLPATMAGLAGGVVSVWLFLVRANDGTGEPPRHELQCQARMARTGLVRTSA